MTPAPFANNDNEDITPPPNIPQLPPLTDDTTPTKKPYTQDFDAHKNNYDELVDIVTDVADAAIKNRAAREKKKGNPITQIEEYLQTQVKEDPILVKKLLRVGFSAYTSNPQNLFIMAPTSEGKTYATTSVFDCFPPEDVIFIGRLSPTALIHKKGVLVDKDNNPVESRLKEIAKQLNKAPDKEAAYDLQQEKNDILDTSRNLVDMTNKILLFLDNPNSATWEMLKPILSHDRKELLYSTTKTDGSLKVKDTIIKGWPAVIACSAKNEAQNEVWQEVESRFMLASPNSSRKKYLAANRLSSLKYGISGFAKGKYTDVENEKWSKYYVADIKTKLIKYYGLCSNPILNTLYEKIAVAFPNSTGESMRYISRVLIFMNIETIINSKDRLALFYGKKKNIQAAFLTTMDDITTAINIFGEISSFPPEKLEFFRQVFLPCIKDKTSIDASTTTEKLATKFETVFDKPMSSKRVYDNYICPLRDHGLVDEAGENPTKAHQKLWGEASQIQAYDLDDLINKLKLVGAAEPNYISDTIQDVINHADDPKLILGLYNYARTKIDVHSTTKLNNYVFGKNYKDYIDTAPAAPKTQNKIT